MSGDTPTEIAQNYFQAVSSTLRASIATNKLDPRDQAYAFIKLAEGLDALAVGVRATYLSLQEVKQLLQRQADSRR